MRHHLGLVAVIATLGGCLEPIIDVTTLHPTPRGISPRAVESVKLMAQMPDNSVAVYGLVASNGTNGEMQAAVHSKAATLGCDGVVITEYNGPGKTPGAAATGQLNDHRELVGSRLLALCVVLAKAEGPPEPARPQ